MNRKRFPIVDDSPVVIKRLSLMLVIKDPG